MEDSIETPASRRRSPTAGISLRQLERLFRPISARGSPGITFLRLERARQLLRETTLPVLDVALATGFVSASHFSRSYRARFGFSPRTERAGRAAGPGALSARAARVRGCRLRAKTPA